MTTPKPLAAEELATSRPRFHNFRWHHGPRRWKRELQLCRFYFERGKVADGHGGTDNKISLKVLWGPRDLWVGVYWDTERLGSSISHFRLYLCLVPCLPIRIHFMRSWGGYFK